MKKNLGFTAIAYFILRAQFVGISSLCLISLIKQDIWIGSILGFILGFIPIFLFYKIASYEEELTVVEKIDKLFPRCNKIIKYTLGIFILFICIMNFWNLTNFIKCQYLMDTPTLAIALALFFPIIYLVKQTSKAISRVGLILFYMSILFIFISIIGLVNKVELTNLMPIMEYNPLKGIIPYISYNVLPMFMLLIFPNKYIKKSIIEGYVISYVSIFVAIIFIISVLGIDIVQLFQYPEFQTLKLMFDGFISSRLENLLAIQWIFDIFIFICVGVKYTNESFNFKKVYIIPIIMVLINQFLFKNNTLANLLFTEYIPYIIPLFLLGIPILIYLKTQKKA